MGSVEDMENDNKSGSMKGNSQIYIDEPTQLVSSDSSSMNKSPASITSSQLLFYTENEHQCESSRSFQSEATIGNAVSNVTLAEEQSVPTLSSSLPSAICRHKGEGDISTCGFRNSSQASGSTDICGSDIPRPYTDVIHITFPDNLLAKALAEICRKRPENPIRYLAFYLKNHEDNKKRNVEYDRDLQAMMEHKRSLEIPEVESIQAYENSEDHYEGSNFTAEEGNYELESESLPPGAAVLSIEM